MKRKFLNRFLAKVSTPTNLKKLMVINIGGLWDRPIPVPDETLLNPSIYSDIDYTESDATDCVYFKSLTAEECDQGETNVKFKGISYSDKDGEEIYPINQPESCSGKAADQETLSKGVSKGQISNVRSGMNIGGRSLCRHASKALRVRSSATKDRHSKVNTAKGLRDRRVRLSVSTALQFYDVQYRLGFDQPSKALDWLMSKAQAAIDELPEPSYIQNLNCLLCNSTTKTTSSAKNVISTSQPSEKLVTTVASSSQTPVEADLRGFSLVNLLNRWEIPEIMSHPAHDIRFPSVCTCSAIECLKPHSTKETMAVWTK